jgi:hypothetical protein
MGLIWDYMIKKKRQWKLIKLIKKKYFLSERLS